LRILLRRTGPKEEKEGLRWDRQKEGRKEGRTTESPFKVDKNGIFHVPEIETSLCGTDT